MVTIPHIRKRNVSRNYALLYRYARVFQLAVLLGTMATLIFAVRGGIPGETAVVSYFDIVFEVFHFANGTTFEIVGIRDSVRFAQIDRTRLHLGRFCTTLRCRLAVVKPAASLSNALKDARPEPHKRYCRRGQLIRCKVRRVRTSSLP